MVKLPLNTSGSFLTFVLNYGTLGSRNRFARSDWIDSLIAMEIFFEDPSEIPLPPDEVRILLFEVDPYPDGRRLRVLFELTPFQMKPHGDIVIFNLAGEPVATTSFVETITPRNEMTVHLRHLDPVGHYRATLTVFYPYEFEDENQEGEGLVRLGKRVVDEKEIRFETDQPGEASP